MPPEPLTGRGEQRSGPVELRRSCAPRPLRHAWERARRGEDSGPPRSYRAGPPREGCTSLGRAEPRRPPARSAARLSFPSPRPPARPSEPPSPLEPPAVPARPSRERLWGEGAAALCVPPARPRCPKRGPAVPLPFPILSRCPPPLCLFFFFLVYFFPPFPPPPRNARIAQPLPDGAPEGLRGPPPHRSPPARSRGRSPHPPFPSSSPSSFSSSPRPSRRLGLSAPSRRCPIPRPGPAGRSGAGGGHCGAFSPPSSGRHPSRSLLFGWLGPPRRKGRDGGRACAHPAPRSRSPSSALRSQLVPSRPAPPDPPPPLPPFLPPPLRPSRSLIEEPGFLT